MCHVMTVINIQNEADHVVGKKEGSWKQGSRGAALQFSDSPDNRPTSCTIFCQLDQKRATLLLWELG